MIEIKQLNFSHHFIKVFIPSIISEKAFTCVNRYKG